MKIRHYIIGLILCGFIFYYMSSLKASNNSDLYDFANALFTGLAFVALIVSLLMQREDLALAREQILITQEEVRQKSEEFKKNSDLILLNQNEQTLFNMLDNAYKKIDVFEYMKENRGEHGDEIHTIQYSKFEAVEVFYKDFISKSITKETKKYQTDPYVFLDEIADVYSAEFIVLDSYYKSILFILDFAKQKFDSTKYREFEKYLICTMGYGELSLLCYYMIKMFRNKGAIMIYYDFIAEHCPEDIREMRMIKDAYINYAKVIKANSIPIFRE